MDTLKNRDGIAIFYLPDAQRSSFGGVWGACLRVLGYLGQSWCVPGVPGMRFGVHLRASEVRLGGVLRLSWGILGGSWRVLAWLGVFLGAFWVYFWKIFCHLEHYVEIAKNIGKNLWFFH